MEQISNPSLSTEQQDAEEILIRHVSNDLKVNLTKDRPIPGETSLEVDGYCFDHRIMCEAWAHIGVPKSAQRNKVMTDALKMIFIEKSLGMEFQKILIFADKEASKPFCGNTWQAKCLKAFNIETRVVEPPPNIRDRIIEAQKRQYR